MRWKLLGVAVALAVSAPILASVSAQAQGPWCAEQGGRNSYRNCGYYTYGQCRAAVSGVGGFCSPNPAAGYGGGYGYRGGYGYGGGPVYGGDYGFGYDVPPPPPRRSRY